MKPYAQTDNYTLYLGDAWQVLDSLPENSVDAVVTDPPYEIGFMNKGWDNTGVAFDRTTWEKVLRVLKPGGHLLAFNHSRTFHRMAVAIEDAGFEIRDTIMWLYGSGFPKSHDISKAIDKGQGENRDRQLKFVNWMRTTGLKQTEINKIIGKVDVGSHYLRLDQPAIATADLFDLLRPYLPEVPEEIERLVAERTGIEWTAYKNREVVGQRIVPEGHSFASERFEKSTKSIETNITTAATDEAKQWEGWGTALKPAYEPILMARKPIPSTVADNVLTHGVGGINIDGCRVGTEKLGGGTMPNLRDVGKMSKENSGQDKLSFGQNNRPAERIDYNEYEGRFPANVIHDGSEEATSDMWDKETDNDASRYFYTAKASKKDRDEGLRGFDKHKANQTYGNGFNTETKLVTQEQIKNGQANRELRHNIHPTVKPTDLMQYLIRLIAPKGATVLDLFMGSGSTGKAAMIENVEREANYHFIGIDRTEEYLPIAQARIEFGRNYAEEKPKADGVVHKNQIDLFSLL
jgi:DNA modification methylase